jgi:Tfp pilus assembly protein PilZ
MPECHPTLLVFRVILAASAKAAPAAAAGSAGTIGRDIKGSASPMADPKILLIVKDIESQAAYIKILDKIGVDFDLASSFFDAQRMATETAYNGLLIDMVALIRTGRDEKSLAYDCINLYPSRRIRWDNKKNLLVFEQSSHTEPELAMREFIEDACKSFNARKSRISPRKHVIMNVLLSTESHLVDDNAEKTFTVDISRGGAFIHTTQNIERGKTVWFRFYDLTDQSPIKAEVCWSLAWGRQNLIPGIGVKFESMTEAQANDIKRIV